MGLLDKESAKGQEYLNLKSWKLNTADFFGLDILWECLGHPLLVESTNSMMSPHLSIILQF